MIVVVVVIGIAVALCMLGWVPVVRDALRPEHVLPGPPVREAAQVIFRLQTIERWGFDPEILFIARKLKYVIREVPVTWGHDERSRLSYVKDGVKMLEEMAIVRRNSVAGRYDQAIAALRDTSTMVTPQVAHGKARSAIVP